MWHMKLSHQKRIVTNKIVIYYNIELKKYIIKFINEELKNMKTFRQSFEEKEELAIDASIRVSSISDTNFTNKIIHYETAIEKQFYKTLHELIRLQSSRSGGASPLPFVLDVNVSTES